MHRASMPDYRRNRVPGGTYFFTVNLLDRRSCLLTTEIDALRQTVRQVRAAAPFHIDGYVVLPEHMHWMWTLPEGDSNFSARWRDIKKGFLKRIPAGEFRSVTRERRGERGVWQRRFWEHTIRDDADYATHLDYIHFNPVKHGLVQAAANWELSSFQHCVKRGIYPADWAGDDGKTSNYGEANVP